jgi:hypothetical protein
MGSEGLLTVNLNSSSGSNNNQFYIGANSSLKVDADITGTYGIDKTGSGRLDLGFNIGSGMSTGLNNFSGGVLLSSGSLYLDQSSYTNNNGAFYSPVGTGTLTIDGGNINSGNGAITITNTVIINTLSPHIDPNVKFTNIQYAQLPGAINVASGTSGDDWNHSQFFPADAEHQPH